LFDSNTHFNVNDSMPQFSVPCVYLKTGSVRPVIFICIRDLQTLYGKI
jgi:hypothetical protein